MLKQYFTNRLEKGLSLIEASMVLVLSAVVVAGVMVYYQTAQTNSQLEKTSAQIMHIVSEINGLYAGTRDNGKGIYAGLTHNTLLNAVPDLEETSAGNIKTPTPNIQLFLSSGHYDPITQKLDSNGPANHYVILLGATLGAEVIKICQKFVALNYGGQSQGIIFNESGQEKFLDASAPLSDKFKQCQKLLPDSDKLFGIIFK